MCDPKKIQKIIDRITFKIRIYREIFGYNQQEMANLLGMALRSYQRIESQDSICDITLLLNFCKILDLDFDEFISTEDPRVANVQKIYLTESEVFSFEENLKKDHLDFYNLLQLIKDEKIDLENFPKSNIFNDFELPLVQFNFQKKYFNQAAVNKYRLKKNVIKTFHECKDYSLIVNILDCVHFYQPKYSILNSVQIITSDTVKEIKSLNAHLDFTSNDLNSLCLLIE